MGRAGCARVRTPNGLRAVCRRLRRGDAERGVDAVALRRALDDVLPRFDVNEVHTVSLACSPERAVELALAAPATPDRLTALLFRARGLPTGSTIAEFFGRMGFETLARSRCEIVIGASGMPWRPSGGLRPFATGDVGTVRVATDIRAVPVQGGCVLSTETRVEAVDERARRAFGRYWRVVGPFSALIRRRWLRAVARAA